MKRFLTPALAVSLTLAACASPPATLPTDLIERAATCGVVAALAARKATPDVRAPIAVDQQGAVLRYALLAGAQTPEFSGEAATAVIARMPVLSEDANAKQLEATAPLCAQAFPEPATPAALPADPLSATLGCDALADFMRLGLEAQGGTDYGTEIARYAALIRALDSKGAAALDRKSIYNQEQRGAARQRALSEVARLGNPVTTLAQCSERFSP